MKTFLLVFTSGVRYNFTHAAEDRGCKASIIRNFYHKLGQ